MRRTKESEESIAAGHSTPTKKFTIGLLYLTAYSSPEIGEFTQFNGIGLDVDDYHKAVYLGIFFFGFSST